MPKVFEVSEQHLFSFLDSLLKLGGMAIHHQVSQFLANLKEKEQSACSPQENLPPPVPDTID